MDIRDFTKRHRDGIVFFLLILSSIVAMMVQSNTVIQANRRLGMSFVAAVQSATSNVRDGIKDSVNSVARLRDLQEQYNVLSKQLDESLELNRSIEALLQENEALNTALEYSRASRFINIPAKVIGKDPGIIFDNIMVNKGSRHGVQLNMPVIAYQDEMQSLVGIVVQVSQNSSLVRPIIDSMSYVSARLTRTRYEGLLQGRGSQSRTVIMDYLDRNSRNQIDVGDEVITSGLNSLYPANLHIGKVTALLGNSYETSLQLEVEPSVDFSRLEHVFILKAEEAQVFTETGER